jgi:DNA (cytosine-5)-methyltransferase 1
MNELALFAGAGGGILGGKILGWRTVCAVEWEPYAASVLCARQNDGLLPPFPIWDDVQTFDGKPWNGIVDVVSGGFPCQDISVAGKGDGLDGERSGMWKHMARVVGEVRPRFVFVENSPMLATRGGTRVIGDLTALGYDCRWTVMGAADVGAPIQRDRLWIVASASSNRLQGGKNNRRIEKSQSQREKQFERFFTSKSWLENARAGRFGSPDGVAARVDRLKAIGNGQVPLCAATAFEWLTK